MTLRTIRDRTGSPRNLKRLARRLAVIVATATLGATLFAPQASAQPFPDCDAYAFVDRRDGTTQTYGGGRLDCEADVLDATSVDVKLYKGSDLRARGKTTCGLPVHSHCGASTEMVTGSSGTWKVEVTIIARAGGVTNKTFNVTSTRTW